MERQQILDLYVWEDDVCFRHPSKGCVPTAVIGVVHPRAESEREVRACADCVIAIEDAKRERAQRVGSEYRPGPAGSTRQ